MNRINQIVVIVAVGHGNIVGTSCGNIAAIPVSSDSILSGKPEKVFELYLKSKGLSPDCSAYTWSIHNTTMMENILMGNTPCSVVEELVS